MRFLEVTREHEPAKARIRTRLGERFGDVAEHLARIAVAGHAHDPLYIGAALGRRGDEGGRALRRAIRISGVIFRREHLAPLGQTDIVLVSAQLLLLLQHTVLVQQGIQPDMSD